MVISRNTGARWLTVTIILASVEPGLRYNHKSVNEEKGNCHAIAEAWCDLPTLNLLVVVQNFQAFFMWHDELGNALVDKKVFILLYNSLFLPFLLLILPL